MQVKKTGDGINQSFTNPDYNATLSGQFLGSGTTPLTRNTRVLVANHREIPAGLLVDEVLGFRRFAETEFSGDAPPTVVRCDRYLAGAFRRGPEQWPVLSLRAVLESTAFAEAAA